MNRMHVASELDVDAERVRARTRIRHVVETTHGDVARIARRAVRGIDLWVQTRVAREEQEVVTSDVHARRLAAHDASGERKGVAERDILQASKGAILDPARRELR